MRLHDLSAAVESLPAVPATKAMQATGTDDRNTMRDGDGCRMVAGHSDKPLESLSAIDKTDRPTVQSVDHTKSLQMQAFDSDCDRLKASDEEAVEVPQTHELGRPSAALANHNLPDLDNGGCTDGCTHPVVQVDFSVC